MSRSNFRGIVKLYDGRRGRAVRLGFYRVKPSNCINAAMTPESFVYSLSLNLKWLAFYYAPPLSSSEHLLFKDTIIPLLTYLLV